MRRSHVVLPVHFVWATYRRMPLILPQWEEVLYHCIAQETKRLKCEMIAVNGMPDHVHLAALLPATVTVAQVAKQVKGVSSHFVKNSVLPPEAFFAWQEGYSAYRFHIDAAPKVATYIANQKQRHANGKVWEILEEMGIDVDSSVRTTGREAVPCEVF